MRRATRSSTKTVASDKPIEPSPVDRMIRQVDGRTVALEATHELLEAAKKEPTPDLSRRIEELTRENGRLRLEIRYHQQVQEAFKDLPTDVKFGIELMEKSMLKCHAAQEAAEEDRRRTLDGKWWSRT
ncbi:hypothetical protein BKA61DRAFT_250663 [Leptodontidium sp. MPI-SDFR-AT-0119]|nr:hypothetical protein BKA61DRAFT_250663 [Leptodontidium sp. MPI-SDFR-AT-0119]